MVVTCPSPDETGKLALRLAPHLKPGMVVALTGDLGTGKSVFARALGRALGVAGPMPSPTFNIVHEYAGSIPVLHIDLYRLAGEEEFELLGIDRMMESALTLVEWPERVPELLETATVTIGIAFADDGPADDRRRITVDWAHGNDCD